MEGQAVLLILLDGLGDVPYPELAGLTPLEAAHTPNLDRLTAEGISGSIYPLGPGVAPSSELAHFAYFGYGSYPFPGRAVLEALARDIAPPHNVVLSFAGLVSTTARDGCLHVEGGYRTASDEEARALLGDIPEYQAEGLRLRLRPFERGDALVLIEGPASPDITDTDPFSTDNPVLEARPVHATPDPDAAAATARALNAYLQRAYEHLSQHPVNVQRHARGQRPLNMLVTRWTGQRRPLPSFINLTGMRGSVVASSRLHKGFAALLGMEFCYVPPNNDPAPEMEEKLAHALDLLRQGYEFVHLHTKAPDEAGHAHDPTFKRAVIEGLDPGLAGLWRDPELLGRTVVAVTADHCTPSRGPLLHSGDSVPLAIRGTAARVDAVDRFGERAAAGGALGQLRGEDVMPLLLNLAGRAAFQGARHAPYPTPGRSPDIVPFRLPPHTPASEG